MPQTLRNKKPAVVSENTALLKTSDDWLTLIDAAREGCDEALGEISRRTQAYLLMVANEQQIDGRLHAKFGTSDVVQQSLLEAHQSFPKFCGNSEAELRSWMKRIVINNLIDTSRRFTETKSRDLKQEVKLESMDGTADQAQLTASAIMSRREADSELRDAIAMLSSKQRRVIELKHRFGWNYSKIAEQMDSSEPAIRMLWMRAVRQLRAFLDGPKG